MGAILTDDVPVKELLKGTGYNVPEDMMDKTWGEATSGGGDVTLIELSATENKVYTPDEGKAYKKVTVNVPSPTVKLYAWKNETNIVYTKTAEPTTTDKALVPAATGLSEAVIAAVAAEFASVTIGETAYARYADGDITVA